MDRIKLFCRQQLLPHLPNSVLVYYQIVLHQVAALLGFNLLYPFQSLPSNEPPPSATPEELLHEKLETEDYEGALEIAAQYHLDTDIVFQLQWINNPISNQTIECHLSAIQNKNWVIEQCLNRLADDISFNYVLIDHGLLLTDLKHLLETDPEDVSLEGLENLVYDEYLDKVQARIEQQKQRLLTQAMENLTAQQRHLITCRLRLLHYRQRLRLLEKIQTETNETEFDSTFYERFRSISLFESALKFAHEANWKALRVLFTYEGDSLLQHRLAILSNFSETISPLNYQLLLPQCSPHEHELTAYRWEESQLDDRSDWAFVHCSEFDDHPNIESDFEVRFYVEQPELVEFRGKELNKSLLSNWFNRRCREIETLSSLISNALTLLSIGIKNNVPNLDRLRDDLQTFQTLVYEIFPQFPETETTFEDFEKLSVRRKIELLMYQASEDRNTFLKRLQQHLLPFVERCAVGNSRSQQHLVQEYLVSVAQNDLSLCQIVVDALNQTVDEGNETKLEEGDVGSVFRDKTLLIAIAIESIYACEEVDQLSNAYNLLDTLPSLPGDNSQSLVTNIEPHCNRAQSSTEPSTPISLGQQLTSLRNHLAVAELLAKHEAFVSPRQVKLLQGQTSSESLRNLFTKILKKATKKNLNEHHWRELLQDLHDMRELCFKQHLTKEELNELYVKTLLACNNLVSIQLATELLTLQSDELVSAEPALNSDLETKVQDDDEKEKCEDMQEEEEEEGWDFEDDSNEIILPGDQQNMKLNATKSTELLVNAAIDYVSSADSINDKIIDFALICLNQFPPEMRKNEIVARELDFIQALRLLHEHFDLKLLPIQLRLIPFPRLDIIQTAAKSVKRGYRKLTILLQVAELIRVCEGKDQAQRETQVLTLLGDMALEEHDYNHCRQVCQILMDKQWQAGWELCQRLGSCEQYSNLQSRYELLAYALTYCEEDGAQIGMIIEEIKRLKIQLNATSTDNTISDLIINKTQNVSGLILNKTQDVALVTSHLTSWLVSNLIVKEDEHTRIANEYRQIEQAEQEEEQQKRKLTVDSILLPAFYMDAFESYKHFNIKMNSLDLDYSSYVLPDIRSRSQPFPVAQLFLRTFLLSKSQLQSQEDCAKINNLLKELAYSALFHDTPLALCYLLSLPCVQQMEPIFDQLDCKSPLLLYLALYAYSVRLCKQQQTEFDVQQFSMRHTIHKAEAYVIAEQGQPFLHSMVTKYRKLFNELIKADSLLSLYPEIDVTRFVNDVSYRHETLLGLAMTESEESLQNVINLAVHYGVSLFEVYLSYVENLFTFSSMPIPEVEKRIFENIELYSAFLERYDQATKVFIERVQPLISGEDYERLVLFYKILERINLDEPESKQKFLIHYKNLRKLSKICTQPPLLNYQQLIERQRKPLDLLFPVLNEQNFSRLAKWISTLGLATTTTTNDDSPLTASAVYSMWLRKRFLMNADERWSDLYTQCLDTIKKLNAKDYLLFVNFYVLSVDAGHRHDSLQRRLDAIREAIQYAKRKQAKFKTEEERQEWTECVEGLEQVLRYLSSL